MRKFLFNDIRNDEPVVATDREILIRLLNVSGPDFDVSELASNWRNHLESIGLEYVDEIIIKQVKITATVNTIIEVLATDTCMERDIDIYLHTDGRFGLGIGKKDIGADEYHGAFIS